MILSGKERIFCDIRSMRDLRNTTKSGILLLVNMCFEKDN